jgi:flavin reductase (DIM6/NTAB) family NADH-FMN oxidoreductase RutF
MMKPVELHHASRLVNHGPTVLVGSAHAGRRNLMAAAWSMPVEFTPPRVVVVIDKSTFTRGLVTASGHFALSVPGRHQADIVYTLGSESGAEADKFERHGLLADAGPVLGLPLLRGCVAHLECRLIEEPHAQAAYDCFFGEVVSAQADERIFSKGHWLPPTADNADLHTLHHLGAGLFGVAAESVQARQLPPRA